MLTETLMLCPAGRISSGRSPTAQATMCDDYECRACFREYRRCACGFFVGLVIIAAVAVIVVLVLSYGHAAQPRFEVEDASLSRFALATQASAISYNLTLTLAVRNPNWAMGATFRSLEADYLFDSQRFDRVDVAAPGYVLPARKTAVFRVSGGADAVNVMLGSAGVKVFRRQSAKGVFDIEAALSGEVKYQLHSSWCRPPCAHGSPAGGSARRRRCFPLLELALAEAAAGSSLFHRGGGQGGWGSGRRSVGSGRNLLLRAAPRRPLRLHRAARQGRDF